jgi:hypothetical protein
MYKRLGNATINKYHLFNNQCIGNLPLTQVVFIDKKCCIFRFGIPKRNAYYLRHCIGLVQLLYKIRKVCSNNISDNTICFQKANLLKSFYLNTLSCPICRFMALSLTGYDKNLNILLDRTEFTHIKITFFWVSMLQIWEFNPKSKQL